MGTTKRRWYITVLRIGAGGAGVYAVYMLLGGVVMTNDEGDRGGYFVFAAILSALSFTMWKAAKRLTRRAEIPPM